MFNKKYWISIDPGLNTGFTLWNDTEPHIIGFIKIKGKTLNEQYMSLKGQFIADLDLNKEIIYCVIEEPNYFKKKIGNYKGKLDLMNLKRTIGWIQSIFIEKYSSIIISCPASRHGNKGKEYIQALMLLRFKALKGVKLNSHQIDSVDIGSWWLKQNKIDVLKEY